MSAMTGQEHTATNLLIAAAAGIGVYIVLVSPSLRRVAWQFLRRSATGTLPAVLAGEVSRAWAPGHRS